VPGFLHDIEAARRQPRVLAAEGHRPWPRPSGEWVMGQTWEDLLFAHWPVEPAVLRAVVPPQIPLDTWEGSAWVGVTPFAVRGLRPRLAPPVPGLSAFAEINVRTYATIEGRPGVVFFSLDAASRVAVAAARRTYRLPYHRWKGSIERLDEDRVRFAGRRAAGPPAAFDGDYGPTGARFTAERGTFEYFAVERYCLYTTDERGDVLRADIHHPPWPLQPAAAELRGNAMGEQLGLALEAEPRLHFARRQDVLFWPPQRVRRLV
jgi:uncharacterized protein YqjF (DUF2071 family)